MSNDRTKKSQQDLNRIEVHEDYELRYWTKELGVTPDELMTAVQKIGPTTKAVREHVGK